MPAPSRELRFRSTLRLLRLGIAAELRNPGIRLLAFVGALASAAFAWSSGSLAGPASVALSGLLTRGFGIAAALWFGYRAIRDLNDKGGAALRSKPVDGAYWVFVTWASGLGVWSCVLFVAFAAAAVAQLPAAGLASLTSHGLGFARSLLVVWAMASSAFALSRIARSPLGGIIVMFAWFCAMAGLKLIPVFLQPDYTQNLPLFLPAGLFLVGVTGLIVERWRRGELRRSLGSAAAVLALLLLGVAGGARAYQSAPEHRPDDRTLWEPISHQYVRAGMRAPGFWLPDGKGGLVRTAPHQGKILVLYLFAPDDLEAARTLSAMQQIHSEFGGRGVLPIGICISPNHGDGALLSRGGGYSFPIGSDLSTLKSNPPESAVAIAYYAQTLPILAVTDRSRRVRELFMEPSYDAARLRLLVEQRLAEEPE